MKRLLSAALALALIIGLALTAFAEENTRFPFVQRTVRVGISPFPHFSEVDSEGNYSGILMDYLTEIQKYTGWKVEYVLLKPEDAVDMLDAGRVDLLGAMNQNDQTRKLYDFAELNSGYSYSTLTVKKTHTEYLPNDYDTFEGIRVGVFTRAKSRVEAFEQFRAANGLVVTPVYFDNPTEWERAFSAGEVDAQLTSSAKLREDEKIIANFKREPYYFGVAKGNTQVLRELNHALEQINQINPHFDADLYQKHFGEAGEDFSMTSDEKDFVAQHPVLRVAATPNLPPVSYFDSDGQYRGISADILTLICEKIGFRLEYVPTQSFAQSLELLETNQVDLLSGIANGRLGESKLNAMTSLPYLPIQAVVLYRKGVDFRSLKNPIMAVTLGFEYNIFEDCIRRRYDGVEASIGAVKRGEADFTAVSNLVGERYMINHGKGGLTLVPMSNVEIKLSFAMNSPTNPVLMTLLDRAIYSITDTQRQAIIFQNTSLADDVTFTTFINANPGQAVFIILSVSLLVLLLLFWVMYMRLRLAGKNALISDTYRIIGELSDEYIFAYDFETETLSLPDSFVKLMEVEPVITRGNCDQAGACELIAGFHSHQTQPHFSMEVGCHHGDGSVERFRAVCVVLHDSAGHAVRGVGKLVSIQAEMEEKQHLERMVNTDTLTGLYSKHYCERWANEAMQSGNKAVRGALLLVDIDNFKAVNDTLGHLGGDEVLKHFARTLLMVFHHGEILGRWGGDEFIIFISDSSDPARVERRAKKLCTSMNDLFTYGDASFELSISVGVAFTAGATSFRQVFQAADEALYQVKRGAKNGYRLAEGSYTSALPTLTEPLPPK